LVYFYADADIPSAFGISNNAKWSRLEVKTSNNRIESIQLRDEASKSKRFNKKRMKNWKKMQLFTDKHGNGDDCSETPFFIPSGCLGDALRSNDSPAHLIFLFPLIPRLIGIKIQTQR
jgi:hypothetical protein